MYHINIFGNDSHSRRVQWVNTFLMMDRDEFVYWGVMFADLCENTDQIYYLFSLCLHKNKLHLPTLFDSLGNPINSPAGSYTFSYTSISLLTPGKCDSLSKNTIFKLILQKSCLCTHCTTTTRWMQQNLYNEKSTLEQVMACGIQATNSYLSQCWPRSMSLYGVTRPEWCKIYTHWISAILETTLLSFELYFMTWSCFIYWLNFSTNMCVTVSLVICNHWVM